MTSNEHSETLSNRPLYIQPFQFVKETTRQVSGSLTEEQKIIASGLNENSLNSHRIPQNSVFVSNKLYSGFIEHVGRCIYGGIVDYDDRSNLSSSSNQNDWHKDRLEIRKDVLKEVSIELGIGNPLPKEFSPMMRWPGGNFVSNYHWQDGIGPIKKRPKRIELAWKGIESNKFGTDEYIIYCKTLGVEPFICLNMGTGTIEEALAWLEYCNKNEDTFWSNLRRSNTGRKESYNVKYWGLGNEMWGEWQVGKMNAKEYVLKAQQWAHALKLLDPSIKLISCGQNGGSEWDWIVLKGLSGIVDFHSIHYYTMLGVHDNSNSKNEGLYEKNVFAPSAAEKYIKICSNLIDLALLEKYEKENDQSFNTKPIIGICFDEWNVWDDSKAKPENNLEQIYDFTDMLATVAWLHVLVRNTSRVTIACLAQSVNVLSPLLTNSKTTLRQTTFYPISMFAKFMVNGFLLELQSLPDIYLGKNTFPNWIQDFERSNYVDIVGIYILKQNRIHLSILNRHSKAFWKAPIRFIEQEEFKIDKVELYTMFDEDLNAINTFEKPNTVIPNHTILTSSEWQSMEGIISVKPHSWCLVLFHGF